MESCRAQFLARFQEETHFSTPLVVVWAGGRARPAYRGDEFQPFQQCPIFQYLFGENPAGRVGAMRLDRNGFATWCVFGAPCTESARNFEGCQTAEKSVDDLRDWCTGCTVFYPEKSFDPAQHATDAVETALRGVEHVREIPLKGACYDVRRAVHHARTRKTPDEIDKIRVACRVTAESIARLQTLDLVGMRESQLTALFRYYCAETEGCHAMAFPPIAASGESTAILHYENGERVLQVGDVVLCDMGCSFQGYCSDVTRTWFVGPPASPHHPWRDIHTQVHRVFAAMVAQLKPGKTWDELTTFVHKEFLGVLQNAGLVHKDFRLSDQDQDQDQDDVVAIFFPHSIGHHLGIETHDRCDTTQQAFAPGMVVALEIGLYVGDVAMEKRKSHAHLNAEKLETLGRGGVRVEDNFLVTATSNECLTTTNSRD